MKRTTRPTKYWIAVVSKDHVQQGIAEQIIQVCHGKQAPLKRMQVNDWVIFYSPKQSFGGNETCQAFTAIGQISDDIIYQHQMTSDFIPYRRHVQFYPAQEVSILPLIHQLDFIENEQHWGYKFRFGFFEIGKHDFQRIHAIMLPDDK